MSTNYQDGTTSETTQETKEPKYLNLDDVYIDLKKTKAKELRKAAIDKRKFRKILQDYYEGVRHLIITKSHIERLTSMGSLYLMGVKMKRIRKKKNLNWNETKKQKKAIFHFNDHTNGLYLRIHWKRPHLQNVVDFKLLPVRQFKREIARNAKDTNATWHYKERLYLSKRSLTK